MFLLALLVIELVFFMLLPFYYEEVVPALKGALWGNVEARFYLVGVANSVSTEEEMLSLSVIEVT